MFLYGVVASLFMVLTMRPICLAKGTGCHPSGVQLMEKARRAQASLSGRHAQNPTY
ncbi:hypothetical protein TC41_0309 [Alicyclobacillus acidocaldarius subsp. acidocaldarius Tc-4-1]|uniref:Uncharacterized protein n=1 Tax=Alicyclobacillus acidocaldarius (strain Tc-4-1) TaxID=1048834 RepID=F8IJT8_ALIAT|nr:hypothetical protein TC41_0309 [Alicyclobacillus acidocaldarius subsp. acidocaldarius Tc-4-1]